MANYYGGGSTKSLSGGGGGGGFTPTFGDGGHSPAPSDSEDFADVGKGSIDLTEVLGSIGKTAGSIKDFATGLVGQVGVPGGPNLGDVAEIPGKAVDAIGQVGFGDGANVGALPGYAGDIVSAPGRFVEGEAAKSRLREQQGTGTLIDKFISNVGGSFNPLAPGLGEGGIRMALEKAIEQGHVPTPEERQFLSKFAIPDDIQARLDSGESIDALANEMVDTGRGFSNDFVQNLASGLVFDPLNLIAPGASGAVRAAGKAGLAIKAAEAGEKLGVGTRFTGTMYNAASRGLSAGGAKLMDGLIGPTTSGVFHALGTKPYKALTSSLRGLAPEYAQAYEDAFARGAAQMPRAVIARYMSEEASAAIRAYGKGAVDRLTSDIGGTIEARLGAIRKINPTQIERRTEELLNKTAPDFLGHTDEGRFVETRDKLAAITGMSPEDAARALGGKASVRTAQHVHLAFYGKAGDALSEAKAIAGTAKNIDAERITLIAPDSLTDELADDILNDRLSIDSAVEQFSILRNRFGGTSYDPGKVRAFIEKLHTENALPKAVRSPVTSKDPLPPALQAWSRAYGDFGYKIGFAPADGWKTIVNDVDGDVIYADPFVHFVSEAEPLTSRNPIGRFMDSLFRGSTQTTIVHDARMRMVKLTRGSGISANEARSAFNRVLEEAAARHVSPRGLSLYGGPHIYEEIFKDVLGPERYADFITKVDPNFAVMKAFEGNLSRVGLTQKFTGRAKSATAGRGNMVAAITEGIYPEIRFGKSPLFQSQELVESPFLNALRGVQVRAVDPELQKVYDELQDLPDFKYLTEAGYFLHIAGNNAVGRTMGAQSLIGKALRNVPNVKAFKERQRVAQVFTEHGEHFERAVNSINPRLWKHMTEAYGTTDPRAIADAFIKERQALASGEMDQAMAVFDAARPSFDEALGVHFRGTDPTYTGPRISTGDEWWDSHLFITDQEKFAKDYGPSIEQLGFKPGSKVLREGTPEFDKIAFMPREGGVPMNALDASKRIAQLAEAEGYDAVHFARQGDVGTIVLNDKAIIRNLDTPKVVRPSSTPPSGMSAGELAQWSQQQTAIREARIAELMQHDGALEFPRTTSGGRSLGTAIVSEDTRPGAAGWRVTYVDDAGTPTGHIEAASREEALRDASTHGSADIYSPISGEAIQRAYDAGDIAKGQALNVQAGVARGANGAGGAMKLTAAEMRKLGITPEQSHDMETVWQAFRESFRQSSEQAFKTHYFNPTRGFLERTINHPYLGLYPASYMWGKVLPEFARFLLKRPFGLRAPLVGAAALNRVQQTAVAALALDPELEQTVQDHEGVIYLMNQLLPGDPTNLVANAPAWARHLSSDLLSGNKIDPQKFVEREAADSFRYAAGPIRSLNVAGDALSDLGDTAGDIYASLEKAAKGYDAQFGAPSLR